MLPTCRGRTDLSITYAKLNNWLLARDYQLIAKGYNSRRAQKVVRHLASDFDERLTGALLDRLTHRAQIVEFVGESYRLRQSLQRPPRGEPPA